MIPAINGKVPQLQVADSGDASYASVTSLMHFDGSNGSTISDQRGTPWTVNGGAQLTTTSPKYGTASCAFDGSGDYLQKVVTSLIGAGDFTVECWVNGTDWTGDCLILGISSGSGFTNYDFLFEVDADASLRASVRNNGSSHCDFNTSAGIVTTGTWHHVACVVQGSTCRVYLNGVQVGSALMSGTRGATQTTHRIGYLDGAVPRYFDGKIDDFRITRGVARYPNGTTFTPPGMLPDLGEPNGWTVDSGSRVTVSAGTAGDAQACATDGVHIWFTKSDRILKYTKAGSLVTSRVVTGDNPTNKSQINGIFHKNGRLYVSAAENSNPRKSYVVEYDPDTLAYITHRQLVGDHFSEGIAWKGEHWWVVFHANMYVQQFDREWNLINTHTLTYSVTGSSGGYGPGTGYDGIVWLGDLILCNIHEIYNEEFCDVYSWNGTGFDQACRLPRPTSIATQGMCKDPVDGRIWFAERGTDGYVACTPT